MVGNKQVTPFFWDVNEEALISGFGLETFQTLKVLRSVLDPKVLDEPLESTVVLRYPIWCT